MKPLWIVEILNDFCFIVLFCVFPSFLQGAYGVLQLGKKAIIISKLSGNNSSLYANARVYKLPPAGQIQSAPHFCSLWVKNGFTL